MTEPDLVDALHQALAAKDAVIAELAALRDRFMAERDEAVANAKVQQQRDRLYVEEMQRQIGLAIKSLQMVKGDQI